MVRCGTRCLKVTVAMTTLTSMTSYTTVTSPFRQPEVTSQDGCREGWASWPTGKRDSLTSGWIPAAWGSRGTSGSVGGMTHLRGLLARGTLRPGLRGPRSRWRGNSTLYETSRRYEFTPTTCSRGTWGCSGRPGCRLVSAGTCSQRHLSNTCTYSHLSV